MKEPRRWAAWLAACVLAASLVVMPREGAASGPFIDGNPPVITDEGDPDEPGATVSAFAFFMFGRMQFVSVKLPIGRSNWFHTSALPQARAQARNAISGRDTSR